MIYPLFSVRNFGIEFREDDNADEAVRDAFDPRKVFN